MEAKCGLTLKIKLIKRNLLNELKDLDYNISDSTTISVTAAIEYLLAEISELGGNVTRDQRRVRMTTGHIVTAIRNDTELDNLFDAHNDALFTTNNDFPSVPNFHTWTYKILKQVHPDTGITADASIFLDVLINKIIKLFASKFPQNNNSIDVNSIIDSIMPGELAKHAKNEASRAITKFTTIEPRT